MLFFVNPLDIKVGLQNDAKRIQRRHRQTPSTSSAAAAVLMHSVCSHRAVIMTSPQDETKCGDGAGFGPVERKPVRTKSHQNDNLSERKPNRTKSPI